MRRLFLRVVPVFLIVFILMGNIRYSQGSVRIQQHNADCLDCGGAGVCSVQCPELGQACSQVGSTWGQCVFTGWAIDCGDKMQCCNCPHGGNLGCVDSQVVCRETGYTLHGNVFDFEIRLPLGKYRHIPEITKPDCGGWYIIRDEEGNVLEEGLAINIIEQSKIVFGQEVIITVYDLSGEVAIRTLTKSGPPEEGYREGSFQLNLPAGSYWAVFVKEGYKPKEIAMIVPWPGSEEFKYEIYLKPLVPYRELSPILTDPN